MPSKPENISESKHEDNLPERPLECGDCKKPIAVCYTEIVSSTLTRTCMCTDCPVFQRHLYGLPAADSGNEQVEGYAGGLACGNCGTTLESVRMGSPFGCGICYDVFDEILILELNSRGKIPPRLATAKKSQTIHIGRASGEAQEISSSMRLLSLNEALSETLKREDYEQAAWLRDQIKALTEAQGLTPNQGGPDGLK